MAARVREVRIKRGLTTADLAARCASLGMPGLTAQTLYKLEGQRKRPDRPPRPVTVDELLALAVALNVAPVHLLVPLDADAPYPVTSARTVVTGTARAWIRGIGPIDPDADPREFYAEVPRGEFYMPAHLVSDEDGSEVMTGPVQQGPPRRLTEEES